MPPDMQPIDPDTLPQAGGSYLRQPDGSLLRVDLPVDQPDTTVPAEQPAPIQE